tara:strand:+ start:56869 stop:57015 length:147 start_codon:yes stop_codon:yes gene_type:complete
MILKNEKIKQEKLYKKERGQLLRILVSQKNKSLKCCTEEKKLIQSFHN